MVRKNDTLGEGDKQNSRYKNVGKKPVFTKVQDRLDDLIMYSSQRLENKKIAELLGISEASFYKLMAENVEFKEAYNKGLESAKYALEKSLLKRAEGFTATETKIETDAEGNIIKQTTTNKQFVPDTTALIFALKNNYGEKYKDKVETEYTVNVDIHQIDMLPNEKLLEILQDSKKALLDAGIVNVDTIEDIED